MNRIKQIKKSQGFTIIEVLIVLAIAGLIILIVFLAVPSLQRNNRNTSRKSDVGRVGSIISEFTSNNNGRLPASTPAASEAADIAKIRSSVGKLSQYDDVDGSYDVVSGSTAQAASTNLDKILIVVGAKCDSATAGATVPGTSRQVALQYAVETSGSSTGICQDV